MVDITVIPVFSSPVSNEIIWKVGDSYTFKKDPVKGFNVYFSHASPHELTQANIELLEEPKFSHKVNNYNKQRRGYYVVEVVTYSGKTFRSTPQNIYDSSSRYMREHIYKSILDSAGAGNPFNIPVAIYQNRHSGVLCSRCGINVNLGNLQSKCPECYGTGFSGGFYTPVLGYVDQQGMTQAQSSLQVTGADTNISKTYALSIAFASVQVGDHIRHLKSPNKLYTISGMTYSEFDTTPITQFIQCTEQESGHPLYLDSVVYDPDFFDPKVYLRSIQKDVYVLCQKFRDSYLRLKSSTSNS